VVLGAVGKTWNPTLRRHVVPSEESRTKNRKVIDEIDEKTESLKVLHHSAKKQAPLKWSPEGEAAFIHVRSLIANNPTLYFIDNNAPIYLMTDSSDRILIPNCQ
jgi:hypothetical protein